MFENVLRNEISDKVNRFLDHQIQIVGKMTLEQSTCLRKLVTLDMFTTALGVECIYICYKKRQRSFTYY
jgi:hypothetical protein